MASWKLNFRVLLSCFIMIILEPVFSNFTYCSNNSVSCSSQFSHLNPSESACRVLASPDCSNWTFNIGGSSSILGSLRLKAYLYTAVGYRYSVFNVTFTDIKWTSLRFRFSQHGYDNKYFCREFHLSPGYNIPELFYDCLWTKSNYEGTPFSFEYEARSPLHTEARKYVMELPYHSYIDPNTQLQNWTSFLYVDISELPVLTAKWQQAPSHFGAQKYRLEVFNKAEDSEVDLLTSEVIQGTNENHELSYKFDTFPNSGVYHFEVRILSDKCTNGLCLVSKSPDVTIRDFITKTVIVGIVGCVILIPLFLFILYMWRRKCQPPSGDAKLPVVLIIYTPSRASHVKCMVTLTKYLRNNCFVEALLDQLDIPDSETKDPFTWCNEAFSRADFVMVVSSPPKCCEQEGIFRDVDVVALHILKEKFSKRSSRSQYFAVLLPYCTEQDIPDEAKNLRMFKLTKDLDKMLWYIHNGGRFPTVMDSARSLLGPKPRGGKSDLNSRGTVLLTSMKEAEYDLVRTCNCKNVKVRESDNSDTENTRCMMKLIAPDTEGYRYERNISESNSTDVLVVTPEPLDVDFQFSIDDLNLTGTVEVNVEPIKKSSAALHSGVDLNALEL